MPALAPPPPPFPYPPFDPMWCCGHTLWCGYLCSEQSTQPFHHTYSAYTPCQRSRFLPQAEAYSMTRTLKAAISSTSIETIFVRTDNPESTPSIWLKAAIAMFQNEIVRGIDPAFSPPAPPFPTSASACSSSSFSATPTPPFPPPSNHRVL